MYAGALCFPTLHVPFSDVRSGIGSVKYMLNVTRWGRSTTTLSQACCLKRLRDKKLLSPPSSAAPPASGAPPLLPPRCPPLRLPPSSLSASSPPPPRPISIARRFRKLVMTNISRAPRDPKTISPAVPAESRFKFVYTNVPSIATPAKLASIMRVMKEQHVFFTLLSETATTGDSHCTSEALQVCIEGHHETRG